MCYLFSFILNCLLSSYAVQYVLNTKFQHLLSLSYFSTGKYQIWDHTGFRSDNISDFSTSLCHFLNVTNRFEILQTFSIRHFVESYYYHILLHKNLELQYKSFLFEI